MYSMLTELRVRKIVAIEPDGAGSCPADGDVMRDHQVATDLRQLARECVHRE